MRDSGRNWLCGIVEKDSFHLEVIAAAEEEDTLFHLTDKVTEEEDDVRADKRVTKPATPAGRSAANFHFVDCGVTNLWLISFPPLVFSEIIIALCVALNCAAQPN